MDTKSPNYEMSTYKALCALDAVSDFLDSITIAYQTDKRPVMKDWIDDAYRELIKRLENAKDEVVHMYAYYPSSLTWAFIYDNAIKNVEKAYKRFCE